MQFLQSSAKSHRNVTHYTYTRILADKGASYPVHAHSMILIFTA